MKVAANRVSNQVLTIDEHGLVARSLVDLIAHAANRHACKTGEKLFLNSLIKADSSKINFVWGV